MPWRHGPIYHGYRLFSGQKYCGDVNSRVRVTRILGKIKTRFSLSPKEIALEFIDTAS